jgi:hypothetical protein
VDLLFDQKLFRSDLTRDQLDTIEGFIAGWMDMYLESYKRNYDFLRSIAHLLDKPSKNEK